MEKKYALVGVCLLLQFCVLNAQNTINLGEVSVVASRILNNAEGYQVSLKGNKYVKGKNSEETLKLLPNVTFENGVFKINGMSVGDIFVDGNKLRDITELKNIPGDIINKVVVKYLAEGEQHEALSGGTIHIYLSRPSENGCYGSFQGHGEWQKSNGWGNEAIGGILSSRMKNLSLYENYAIGEQKNKSTVLQITSDGEKSILLEEKTKNHATWFRNRLSLTQQFHAGASLGASYFVSTNKTFPKSSTPFKMISGDAKVLAQEGTLKYTLPINRIKGQWEIISDYYNRISKSNKLYVENEKNTGSIEEKDNLNMWKFSSILSQKITKWSMVGMYGASVRLISSHYTPFMDEKEGAMNLSNSPCKNQGLSLESNVSFSGTIGLMRYSAGLKGQFDRIKFFGLEQQVDNANSQWALNPTIQMMLPLGKKKMHSLMFTYKRVLSDIPYSAISNASTWVAPNYYVTGNPDLKAPSSDVVMLGAQLFKNKLLLSAVFSRAHNRIYWQTFIDNERENVFFTKPVNLSSQNAWGINGEWNENPIKCWNFKLSGRLEVRSEAVTIGKQFYDKSHVKTYFTWNNNFSFAHGWGGYVNAEFEPTYRNYDRTYHSVYLVDGQIFKVLLKGKLQLSLDFVAFGKRRVLDRQLSGTLINRKDITPVQKIGLTVLWKFSGGKNVRVNALNGIQDYHEIKDN